MRSFYPCALLCLVLCAGGMAQDSAKPNAKPQAATSAANADRSIVNENPVTVKTTNDVGAKKPVDTDPVFGVPPLPAGKTTLVGGRVSKIDGVHNWLGVKVFGGGKWTIAFDERTHFYRDGAETTFEKVKKGDRVYVDTMLDGHRIFARNVHIVTKTGPAHARGQVTAFNNGVITLRDTLSARPVDFRVDNETQVKRNGEPSSISEVQPGSLVIVQFAPDNASAGVAREITILAAPGQAVTLAGKVMNIDLSNNQIAVENRTDNQTYEIALDGHQQIPPNMMVGSEVTVATTFDGKGYKANRISVEKQ